MKIKRVVASIGASFDQFVTKMENHEAVADSVISDIGKKAARIKAELHSAEQRLQKYHARRDQNARDISQWRERAKSCVVNDEARAMACLQQVRILEDNTSAMVPQVEEMESLVRTLRDNLTEVEARLRELQAKRSILSTRDARAKVMRRYHEVLDTSDSVAVFDRWELGVMENEYQEHDIYARASSSSQERQVDRSLAEQFDSEEEQACLLNTLDQLKREVVDEKHSKSLDDEQVGGGSHDR